MARNILALTLTTTLFLVSGCTLIHQAQQAAHPPKAQSCTDQDCAEQTQETQTWH